MCKNAVHTDIASASADTQEKFYLKGTCIFPAHGKETS